MGHCRKFQTFLLSYICKTFMCMVSFSSKMATAEICLDDIFLCRKCCPKLLITVRCALQNNNKCQAHQKHIGVYNKSINNKSIMKIDLVMFHQFNLAFVLQFFLIIYFLF